MALAEHLALAGASGEGGSLTLASMARAVWFSDFMLARTLLARSELARNRISILGTGVQILDHVASFRWLRLTSDSPFLRGLLLLRRTWACSVVFGNPRRSLMPLVPCIACLGSGPRATNVLCSLELSVSMVTGRSR